MNKEDIKKDMWNTAAKAGLVLGAVSAAYMFLTLLFEKGFGFGRVVKEIDAPTIIACEFATDTGFL